jgi:hypothetical protein
MLRAGQPSQGQKSTLTTEDPTSVTGRFGSLIARLLVVRRLFTLSRSPFGMVRASAHPPAGVALNGVLKPLSKVLDAKLSDH